MIKERYNFNDEDKKMLKKVFWRTLTLSSTYNYERMQGLGYVYTMIPVIKRFWKDPEDQKAAYKRHFELFNTTPTMGSFITGLSASMEKEAAADPEFDKSSINAVKVSLMGPFAGIGDSIFWGALRVITLGIGVSLAMTGNILGAIIHLLLFNAIAFIPRYYGTYLGYGVGSNFIRKAIDSGVMGLITKGASIIGLMTVGAMTCTMVRFSIPLVMNIEGNKLELQTALFDAILPGLLPLLLTFVCYKCISKGVKPIWLMLMLLVLGVLGSVAGIF
jgi:Phosphotransferase system, mannose/fructose/N-acetylgalactosamine-specific component IID